MAPMARTSRGGNPSNNVDALDNLDLDDMFTAGGDALFEGLDLDMGNMEEITDNNKANAASASSPKKTDKKKKQQSEPAEELPKRRKTKRKTTAPTFFDDLDDDYADIEPAKKKKRTSKAAAPKRGRGKKGGAAAEASPPTPASTGSGKKSTKSKNTTVATPSSSGGVSTPPTGGPAAVGLFGNRQKKLGAKSKKSKAASQRTDPKGRPMLPTAANRAAATPVAPAPPLPPPSVPAPMAPRPAPVALPPSLYCGLPPSKEHFYPFLPALPSEVALKNRKAYTLLDRVHSSLMGYFGHGGTSSSSSNIPQGVEAAKDGEPIFKLTQEAFKEDKNATTHATPADRSKAIGMAIGAIRKTISVFDKVTLAKELLSVCTLLRRQHDFVKQNNANMERWCREHFSDEDFASVYQEGKKKRKASDMSSFFETGGGPRVPVLSTFRVPQVKVKISCTGFKEPKATLFAVLPPDPKRAIATRNNKKKGATDGSAGTAPTLSATSAAGTLAGATTAAAADLSYTRQTPARRRKSVSVLLSKVAHTLESRQNQKLEKARQARTIQDKRRKDVAEDTSVAVSHTAGMWKYMQESGYFEETLTDSDLRERFESIQPLNTKEAKDEMSTPPLETAFSDQSTEVAREGIVTERLIELLVEEGTDSENDSEDENDESSQEGDTSVGYPDDVLDLSDLTENERSLIPLRMMKLVSENFVLVDSDTSATKDARAEPPSQDDQVSTPPTKPVDEALETSSALVAGEKPPREEEDDDAGIDDIVARMIEDLQSTNTKIGDCTHFAQRMVRSRLETPEELTRRRQREASILVRGAALIKRNREAKAKAGKAKSKQDDDLKLPW